MFHSAFLISCSTRQGKRNTTCLRQSTHVVGLIVHIAFVKFPSDGNVQPTRRLGWIVAMRILDHEIRVGPRVVASNGGYWGIRGPRHKLCRGLKVRRVCSDRLPHRANHWDEALVDSMLVQAVYWILCECGPSVCDIRGTVCHIVYDLENCGSGQLGDLGQPVPAEVVDVDQRDAVPCLLEDEVSVPPECGASCCGLSRFSDDGHRESDNEQNGEQELMMY